MSLFRKNPSRERVPATDAQIGYIVSLMDELDADTIEVELKDINTGEVSIHTMRQAELVRRLSKGDASQLITQLLEQAKAQRKR